LRDRSFFPLVPASPQFMTATRHAGQRSEGFYSDSAPGYGVLKCFCALHPSFTPRFFVFFGREPLEFPIFPFASLKALFPPTLPTAHRPRPLLFAEVNPRPPGVILSPTFLSAQRRYRCTWDPRQEATPPPSLSPGCPFSCDLVAPVSPRDLASPLRSSFVIFLFFVPSLDSSRG